jgi:hypothetical protein
LLDCDEQLQELKKQLIDAKKFAVVNSFRLRVQPDDTKGTPHDQAQDVCLPKFEFVCVSVHDSCIASQC